jgi:hypothetical protein
MQIVPDKFTAYVIEANTKKNALVRSGVAVDDPTVAKLINGTPEGGNIIQIPFYKPLTGEAEVFGEDEMEAGKVTTGVQNATLLARQKTFGASDLARVLGGSDPMAAITTMVGEYWLTDEQTALISILSGLFTGNSAALNDHLLDISAKEGADAVISTDATLDAKQLMGDAANKLGLVVMHSAVHTKLQKDSVIETIPDPESHTNFETYLGYEVIVDDSLPVSDGVYTTYFLGKGAFARADGAPAGFVTVEKERLARRGQSNLITRRAYALHPVGCSFNRSASLAKAYASNEDLATPANWTLAQDGKNVPIVALKHRIAVVTNSNTTDPEENPEG